jgi:hypothetical protein
MLDMTSSGVISPEAFEVHIYFLICTLFYDAFSATKTNSVELKGDN